MIATLTGVSFFNPVIENTTIADKNRVSTIEHTGPGSSSIRDTTYPASSNTPGHLDSKGKLSGSLQGLGDLEAVEGDKSYVFIRHKSEEGTKEKEETDDPDKENNEETQEKQAQKHEDQKQGRGGDLKQKHEL
jgi:hypothetical protein